MQFVLSPRTQAATVLYGMTDNIVADSSPDDTSEARPHPLGIAKLSEEPDPTILASPAPAPRSSNHRMGFSEVDMRAPLLAENSANNVATGKGLRSCPTKVHQEARGCGPTCVGGDDGQIPGRKANRSTPS